MEFTMRKVRALFKKEIKTLPKNKNILLISIMPVAFSIIYSQIFGDLSSGEGMSKMDIIFMCLSMNLTLVSSYMMGMLISEEKEKNTLRSLILSGVAPMEFLAGKMLITLLITTISNIAMYLIIGLELQYLGIYVILTTLVVLSMIEIGAIIGMIAPNQMSTGVIGMPILIIFFMIPVFAMLNETMKKIAEFLPNYVLKLMLDRVMKGETIGTESIGNIAILLIWIIISAVAFIFTYHKVGLDK